MKILKVNLLVFIIFLSLSLIVSCSKTEGPLANEETPSPEAGALLKGAGPSASGQGRIAGTDRMFAFNAVTHKDGSVSGQGQLNNHLGAKIHFSIDCISVSDNVAMMSGTVTNSTAFPEYVGGPCWFKVKDNGEGANAPQDEITFFIFCTPEDTESPCDNLTCGVDWESEAGGLQPIENGNIQVKP